MQRRQIGSNFKCSTRHNTLTLVKHVPYERPSELNRSGIRSAGENVSDFAGLALPSPIGHWKHCVIRTFLNIREGSNTLLLKFIGKQIADSYVSRIFLIEADNKGFSDGIDTSMSIVNNNCSNVLRLVP